MQIKAIIADVDVEFIEQMESCLSELWPELVVCGRAGSGPEALELFERHQPRLAFMEVRLPGICGMQVARKIAGACAVIFTTGYDHYAVNAFDTGAVDYLIKPVKTERLKKAIQRAGQRLLNTPGAEGGSPRPQKPLMRPLPPGKPSYLQWVCTQSARRSNIISVDEVCYFKADHKYTSVITGKNECLINKPIKSLSEELDPNRFWRIHRSTIVNVSQINQVTRSKTGRGEVMLKDRAEVLTVSRPYLYLFKQM